MAEDGVTPGHQVPLALRPPRLFDEACEMVIAYLSDLVPMGLWAVTRIDDDTQVLLVVEDKGYGVAGPGLELSYAASLCKPMVEGRGPRIAPDTSQVPAYVEAAATAAIDVGAYIGTPIVRPDGSLFGTLCGFDPGTKPADLAGHLALLELLSALLSSVLEADTAVTEAERALERAVTEADTDALTGLMNRRGWDRFLAREEHRYRRFGEPASVLVLDLDLLKQVNDTRGHDAGDRYIQAAADTLRSTVRRVDALARLGGDEFAMVVRAGAAESRELIARLEQALEQAGVLGSFGLAPYSIVSGFPGAVQAADQAMYERKRARRGARLP